MQISSKQDEPTREEGEDLLEMLPAIQHLAPVRKHLLLVVHKRCKPRAAFNSRELLLGLLIAICLSRLLGELGRQLSGREQAQLTAWASWIGEVPTAAELYGDSSSDAPATDAFEDDDEDEELDSAATNEYPDNEGDNDESYEDNDDNQESQIRERWLRPNEHKLSARQSSRARSEPLRRHKRQVGRQSAEREHQANQADPDDADDGEEGSWVNDGVDDINIDPETQRAASEHSYDTDKNLDAEYEPEVANRTRVTTITEVIPISLRDSDDHEDSTSVDSRYLMPPAGASSSLGPPASHLSLEEAQRIVEEAANSNGDS